MRRSLLAVFLLVAGCAVGAPAATPSPAGASLSAPPTAAPTATAAPSAAPTATAGASAGYSCDPDAAYGCDTPAPTSATGSVVVGTAQSAKGTYLVGAGGLALYANDNDRAASSTCSLPSCVDNWPPLSVAAGQQASGGSGVGGTFTTLARDDGTTQVVYNGKPLYYFVGDQAPGDINGDGLGGIWHIAKP
ncbi:MAG: COG4315 family predicted lipoprotein [Mycobacterium sp.]